MEKNKVETCNITVFLNDADFSASFAYSTWTLEKPERVIKNGQSGQRQIKQNT